jgi:hypothetical protein
MPIPAPRFRPSNLNTQQRAEGLAAVYGVEQMSQFTPEEVERMRKIVMENDQQKPVETIDLNNPKPKPYRFQKFPKMIYSTNAAGTHLTVSSEEELQDAIESGQWTEEAPAEIEQAEPYLSPALQREADLKQAEIDELKRQRQERMAAARAAKAAKV